MIVDLLDEAGGSGDRPALVSDDRSWTYGELDSAVSDRADGLAADGAMGGQIVPISMDATHDAIVTLLALWRLGASVAPLSARLTAAEREAAVRALMGEPCEAQAVLWTSGTEGRPRGVAISYRNLVASAQGARERLDLGAEDVWLVSLSPAHIGGLALITRALLLGACLVTVGSPEARRALALIDGSDPLAQRCGPVTHVSLVPTQLHRLLEAYGSASPPGSFRCALIGGAHTPASLVSRALAAGWPLAITYGLTEATSQVATAAPALTRAKPGTVGHPLDGVDLRVAEDGEILVRGATVASQYLGAESATVVSGDGWLHTGDIGKLDADGDLWVTGRRSDRIVTGGVTVDAVEVEEAIRAHPEVADSCVVGLPDPEWGERVAAWVEPRAEGLEREALLDFLRERLSGPKLPRVLHLAEGLPRNVNGKADRTAVREGIAASAGRSA